MTSSFDDIFVRNVLGLGPDAKIDELEVQSRRSDVGEGRSHAPLPRDADIAALLATKPHYTDLEDVSAALGGPDRAKRWERDPGVVVLQGIAAPTMLEGRVAQDEDAWIIDARGERAFVVVPVEGGDLVVGGAQGTIRSFKVLRSVEPDPLALRLEELGKELPQRLDRAAALDVPPPERLLQGIEAAPWLVARARELHASPDLFERVASVGFVARLGAATAKRPGDLFERLVAGAARSPAELAAEWARSLGDAALDELERLLLEAADLLVRDLRVLAEVVSRDDDDATRATRAVCHGRDDLESVACVLSAAGRARRATAELEAIDAEAAVHLSTVDFALDPDDDLLATVAWQEPEAWWGAVRRA